MKRERKGEERMKTTISLAPFNLPVILTILNYKYIYIFYSENKHSIFLNFKSKYSATVSR